MKTSMLFAAYVGVISLIPTIALAQGEESTIRGARLVENSYIISFHPSTASKASPIWPKAQNKTDTPTKFGEHSTGQSKEALARDLRINGRVLKIFEAINAAHIEVDAGEANRLRKDERVASVLQNVVGNFANASPQFNPGWALDRLDQAAPPLNSSYAYPATGKNQTIYIVDSGLDLANPAVAAEFKFPNTSISRASVIYDVNGGSGIDCYGHGTRVASAAASNTYGVAKEATIVVVKITANCSGASDPATWINVFNWLAINATRGTIVNFSYGFQEAGPGYCNFPPMIYTPVEDAIRAAHAAGVIVVVSAGNDGCDIQNYTPQRIPEAFAVGATSTAQFPNGKDARSHMPSGFANPWQSRFGTNVAGFAPGQDVDVMDQYGARALTDTSGTSLAAPYVAGLFAVACQVSGNFCSTMPNASWAYTEMRNLAGTGTVVNHDGTSLPAGTTSRFFRRLGW